MSRYRIGDTTADVHARQSSAATPGRFIVTIDDREIEICAERGPDGCWRIELPDGTVQTAVVSRDRTRRWVHSSGPAMLAEEAAGQSAGADQHAGGLEAPMPGKVLQVLVAAGDSVEAGQTLVIMEAMKMEHAIKAPHDGVVTVVTVVQDDMVEPGRPLVEVTPPEVEAEASPDAGGDP